MKVAHLRIATMASHTLVIDSIIIIIIIIVAIAVTIVVTIAITTTDRSI